MGRRIEKNVNGRVVKYLYDGTDVAYEFHQANRPIARYTHRLEVDEPLIMERDQNGNGSFGLDERFFYQAYRLRSIVALTDNAGSIVERYQHDSFGGLTTGSEVGKPFFLTGREWDPEIGTY